MYKRNGLTNTKLEVNKSDVGQRIETKIELMMNNGEPITEGAELIYTERKDGVIDAYNPRTDRFEVAADAMSVANKSKLAKREERMKIVKDGEETKNDQSQQDGQKSGDPSQ